MCSLQVSYYGRNGRHLVQSGHTGAPPPDHIIIIGENACYRPSDWPQRNYSSLRYRLTPRKNTRWQSIFLRDIFPIFSSIRAYWGTTSRSYYHNRWKCLLLSLRLTYKSIPFYKTDRHKKIYSRLWSIIFGISSDHMIINFYCPSDWLI